MSKRLNITGGFSTLKNQPYDVVEHAGGFKTEIDWTKFEEALEENSGYAEIYSYHDSDSHIMIYAADAYVMSSGKAEGYMILYDGNDGAFIYANKEIEMEGLTFTANTWQTLTISGSTMSLTNQIPTLSFTIDESCIENAELLSEILSDEKTYSIITVEDKVDGVLKDKVYEQIPQKINFLDIPEWDKLKNITSDTSIYEDNINYVNIEVIFREGFLPIPNWDAFDDLVDSASIYDNSVAAGGGGGMVYPYPRMSISKNEQGYELIVNLGYKNVYYIFSYSHTKTYSGYGPFDVPANTWFYNYSENNILAPAIVDPPKAFTVVDGAIENVDYFNAIYSENAIQTIEYNYKENSSDIYYIISSIPLTEINDGADPVTYDANTWYKSDGTDGETPEGFNISDPDNIQSNYIKNICNIEYSEKSLSDELDDRAEAVKDDMEETISSLRDSVSDATSTIGGKVDYTRLVGGVNLSSDTYTLENYIANQSNTNFNIKDNTSYVFNYDVNQYLPLVSDPLNSKVGTFDEIYGEYYEYQYVKFCTNYYPSLSINTKENGNITSTYAFHIYPNRKDYPGKWLNRTDVGSDNLQEWQNPTLSFTYHESNLTEDYEGYLKAILTYDDNGTIKRASADDHLIDGKTYDIDFNVLNYMDLFILFLSYNMRYQEFYDDDSIKIQCANICDYNGLQVKLNNVDHYLSSSLYNYPFVWRKGLSEGEIWSDNDLRTESHYKFNYLDIGKIKSGKTDILKRMFKSEISTLKSIFDNFKNWNYDINYNKNAGGSLVEGKYYLLKNKPTFTDISDFGDTTDNTTIYRDNKGNSINIKAYWFNNGHGGMNFYLYIDVYTAEDGLVANGTTFAAGNNIYREHSYQIYNESSFCNNSYIPKFVALEYKPEYVLYPTIFEKLIDNTYTIDSISNTLEEKIDASLLNSKPYEYTPIISLKNIPNWNKIKDLFLNRSYDLYGETIYNGFNEISTSSSIGKIFIGYNKASDYWYVQINLDSSDLINVDSYYIIASNNFTISSDNISADTWYYKAAGSSSYTQVITPTPTINISLIENKYLFGAVFDYVTTLEEKFDSISQFPACPTITDGTFVLKATVSDGTVTYAWVQETNN